MTLDGFPRVNAGRCTRFRFRYSACRRCADACPHDAIALHDSGVAVDPRRCQDCALCIDACHTGALGTKSYAPVEMLREAIRHPAWSVACTPSGARADALVPCLGAIGPVILAYLARRGIALTMRGASHCGQCAHGVGGAGRLAAHLETVRALSDAARLPGDARWVLPVCDGTPVVRGDAGDSGAAPFAPARRQLFRRLVTRAADHAAGSAGTPGEAPPPERAIRAGAWHVPEQRELLDIVLRRTDDLDLQVPLDDDLPLMRLVLRPGCTSCEACFRVCPTGALSIEENPDDWALVFQSDRCVACQVCIEACQPRVLDAAAVVDARPDRAPVRLLERVKQRCARCDRHFASALPRETCPVCSDDDAAFSEIFG